MSLEDIREKKHGKGVYIIVGFLLVGMAGFGTNQFGTESGGGNDVILTAGKSEITAAEYQNTLHSVQQRNPDMSAEYAQKVTLDALKQRVALADYLRRYPLAASNQQIDRTIANNPAFFDNGKFSDEAFRRLIPVSPSVYRKGLSNDMAMQTLQQTIAETGIVSKVEVQPYVDLGKLNRDILVAKIARSKFVDTANADEVQAYYDAHKDQYMTDEKISIEYIDFNPEQIIASTEIDDKALSAMAQPPREAKYHVFKSIESAQTAYDKFTAGSDISSLKTELSSSIEDSGDLGSVTAISGADSLLSQDALDAIYALEKIGDLTAPIFVDKSVYLFELSSIGAEAVSVQDKALAKTNLQAKKAATQIAELGESLNKAVFENSAPTLESIKEATKIAIINENNLSTNEKQGVLAAPELLAAIQAGDKAVNKLHEPVTIGERVIIYRLTSIEAPKQKPLSDVTEQVTLAASEQKTSQQIEKAKEALVTATKNEGLESAAVQAGFETKAIKDFAGTAAEGDILDPVAAMLIMREPPKLGNQNAIAIDSPIGDSYVYVTTDIRLGEAKPGSLDAKAISTALTGQIGQLELNRFLQVITKKSDVKVKTSLLSQ